MIIQLRSTITYDVVGDQVVFLNPDTQAVFSLPLEVVAGINGTTLTLTSETPPSYLSELNEAGLTDIRPSTLSRRKLLAGTGAVAGAGLMAMSLPAVAAASSGGILPTINGQWSTDDAENSPSFVIYAGVLGADVPEINAANFGYDTRSGEWSVDVYFGAETVNLNYAYADPSLSNPRWRWNNNLEVPPIVSPSAIHTAVNTVRSSTNPVNLTGLLRRNGQPFANLALSWRDDVPWRLG